MSLSFLVYAIQVVLGIGLVIFVHELGHFLAARWCGARVEVFSLGFGPRLFGWQRGDTMFQVAAVPLGGFVKVAGEYHDGTGPEEEGTLSSLNVGQRFLYYSGGVIMNVLFALVVMPLVMFAGVPSEDAVIGSPDPGYPAWEAGVPAGSRVLAVNGEEILDFHHLVTAVAVNGKDDVTLEVQAPGGEASQTFVLTPKFDEKNGVYRIGVPLGMDPARELVITPDSPASAAGLVEGDRLVRVLGQPEGLSLQRQLARALTKEVPAELVVTGPDGAERTVRVEPRIVTKEARRIGVGALANRVVSVRSSGALGGFPAELGIRVDDELLSIAGVDAFGYRDVEDALGALAPGATLEAVVLRDGEPLELSAELPPGVPPVAFLADVALGLNTDTSRVSVEEGSAASVAGLVDGDRILTVDGAAVSGWPELLEAIQRGTEHDRPLEVVVEHADGDIPFAQRVAGAPTENLRVTLSGRPVEAPDFGVTVRAAFITLEAETFGAALALGTRLTIRTLVDISRQLKKMIFSDEISAKNTGGIITISALAYDTASQGLSKLFFFLALLSINLAIINLLPIPILDGGHLLFLLIEAIKGSPVSERTFGYSQVVGLVMIMSLMVYVTYQDIVRWFLRS